MLLALAGNQNCGKTTFFNALTGSNQHVGNFPGVTVAKKSGEIKGRKDITVVDLPGIYSLRPYTPEEKVTRDFLLNERPDGIINIIDAGNPDRNLYLTLQLLELHIPTVVCLNMMDEVKNNGGGVDEKRMSELLGVPVIPVSAANNEGIDKTVETVIDTVKKGILPINNHFYESRAVRTCIERVADTVTETAGKHGFSPLFCAVKLVEEDEDIINLLVPGEIIKKNTERAAAEMESETDLDRNAALASERYSFIEKLCTECIVRPKKSKEKLRSEKADRILTGKYTAVPVFLIILLTVFFLTFFVIGNRLSDLTAAGIDILSLSVKKLLVSLNINSLLLSLICDGIFPGVGSVLSFLPLILVLFFFLSILEDTGYMARIAFIMDKPLRKAGLSGKSIVPMLIGLGCSVPAVMATRTVASDRDRKMTVLLIPFMSCSAKIPIYTVFARAFFPGKEIIVMLFLYLTGIMLGISASVIMKKTVFKGDSVPFIMELPNYRMPSFKSVGMLMWEKAKDFIQKAFTVIFTATVIIWFLNSFDSGLHYVENSAFSILASAGKFLTVIFKPLGISDWRIPAALISGFTAKEAVVSTLSVLTGTDPASLALVLPSLFTVPSAISFLVFSLLYTPCIAAVTAIRRELCSLSKTVLAVMIQCAAAWLTAFVFFRAASFF